jgi:glycosyltransferase involved in cell wall biosynthesis
LHGHEVHLAVGVESDLGHIGPGITVHEVRSLVRRVSPRDDLRAVRELERLIRSVRADLVHTHQSKAGVVGRLAAQRARVRAVHTVHLASFGPGYGRLSSAAFVRAERWCARSTHTIVTVGEELRQQYLDAGIGQPDQYVVVRSPIDIAAFAAVRSNHDEYRAVARQQLGLRDESPVALVVASLEPRKRVGLIVERLAPRLGNGSLTLLVAGSGSTAPVETLARSLGVADRVRLLGHVEDMPRLFGAADVVVHAATQEGVPQVVIQALAAGAPVVATQMVGLHEVVGAPVRVVDSSASGLLGAVDETLAVRPEPVDLKSLEEWMPERVDRVIGALHDQWGFKSR